MNKNSKTVSHLVDEILKVEKENLNINLNKSVIVSKILKLVDDEVASQDEKGEQR